MKILLTSFDLQEAAQFSIDFANTLDPMRDPKDLLAQEVAARGFLGPYLETGEQAASIGQALMAHRDRVRAAFLAIARDPGKTSEVWASFAPDKDLSWHLEIGREGGVAVKPDVGQSAVSRLTTWSSLGFLALAGDAPERLRVCQSAPCEEIFHDRTKAGRQRFCSKRCNTRFNVAQHRARERAEQQKP